MTYILADAALHPVLPHGQNTLPLERKAGQLSNMDPFGLLSYSLLPRGEERLPQGTGTNRKRLQSLSLNKVDSVRGR